MSDPSPRRPVRWRAMAATAGQAAGLATLAAGIWDGLGRAAGLVTTGASLLLLGVAAEFSNRRGGTRAR